VSSKINGLCCILKSEEDRPDPSFFQITVRRPLGNKSPPPQGKCAKLSPNFRTEVMSHDLENVATCNFVLRWNNRLRLWPNLGSGFARDWLSCMRRWAISIWQHRRFCPDSSRWRCGFHKQ